MRLVTSDIKKVEHAIGTETPFQYGSTDLDTHSTCVGYGRALICCWPKLITPGRWRTTYATPQSLMTSEGPDDDCYCDILFDGYSGRITAHGAENLNFY